MKLKKKVFKATAQDFTGLNVRAYDCVDCIDQTCKEDHSIYAYMTAKNQVLSGLEHCFNKESVLCYRSKYKRIIAGDIYKANEVG